MISFICFLVHCHTSPPPKWEEAGESVIFSISVVHWWIIRVKNSIWHMVSTQYSFVEWMNMLIIVINGASQIFLGELFPKSLCTMDSSSIIIQQHFLEIYFLHIYSAYLFEIRYLRMWVRFICVCFISVAAFLSIYDPKSNSIPETKKMYSSMNKFWFTIWKEAKKIAIDRKMKIKKRHISVQLKLVQCRLPIVSQ